MAGETSSPSLEDQDKAKPASASGNYTDEQVAAVAKALAILGAENAASNLDNSKAHDAVEIVWRNARTLAGNIGIDVKGLNDRQVGQAILEREESLRTNFFAEHKGASQEDYNSYLQEHFENPGAMTAYGNATKELAEAGVFSSADNSSAAPSVDRDTQQPDNTNDSPNGEASPAGKEPSAPDTAPSQPQQPSPQPTYSPTAIAAISYIRENVFPALDIKAGTTPEDFRDNYALMNKKLAAIFGMEGSEETYPNQLKSNLDTMAQDEDTVSGRKILSLPGGDEMFLALLEGRNPDFYKKLPEALKQNPEMLYSILDNRSRIVEQMELVQASGVLEPAPQIIPASTNEQEPAPQPSPQVSPSEVKPQGSESSTGAPASVESVAATTQQATAEPSPTTTSSSPNIPTGNVASSSDNSNSDSEVSTSTAQPESTAATTDDKIVPTPVSASGSITDAQVSDAARVVESALIKLGGAASQFGGGMVADLTGFKPPEKVDGVFDKADQDALHMTLMALKKLGGDLKADGTYSAAIGKQLYVDILTKPQFGLVRNELGINGTYTKEEVAAKGFLRSQKVRDSGDLERIAELNVLIKNLDVLNQAHKLDNERARDVTFMGMMMEGISGFLPDGIKSWLQDFFENDKWGKMIGGILTKIGFPVHVLWGGKAADNEDIRPQIVDTYKSELEAVGYDQSELKQRFLDKMDNSTQFKFIEKLLFRGDNKGFMKQAIEGSLDAASVYAGDPEKAAEVFADTLLKASEEFQSDMTPEERDAYFEKIKAVYESELKSMPGVPTAQGGSDHSIDPAGIAAAVGTSNAATVASADHESGAVRPGITPASHSSGAGSNAGASDTGDITKEAADAETVDVNGERFEIVFTPNDIDYVQGPLRYSYGRVADLQNIISQNADALELSVKPAMFMQDGKATDMMTRNTNMALEELLVRSQLAKGVDIDDIDHKYTDKTLSDVADYMRERGLSQSDVSKFTDTIKDLRGDMKATDPRDPDAGDVIAHSVWDQSYIHDQVSVRASAVPVPAAESKPVDNRYPGLKMSGDNDLPPGMTLDDILQRYKDFNSDKNDPNCAPLIFKHQGKAYAAVVIEKTNTFKVEELEGYIDENSPTYRAISDSDYNLLHDNYNWRDGSHLGIINYIDRQLCLDKLIRVVDTPKPEAAAAVVPENESLKQTFHRHHDARGVPKSFRDLPKLTDDEINSLDHGNLDSRELRFLYDRAVAIKEIPNGGALLTRLNDEDAARLGGDIIITVRHGYNGELDHRLVNFEDHKIKIGPLTEDYSERASIRRLDDFLDTGYDQMAVTVLSERMGNRLTEEYKYQHKYSVNDGLQELYGRPDAYRHPSMDPYANTASVWHRLHMRYQQGDINGQGFETRKMLRDRRAVLNQNGMISEGRYEYERPHTRGNGHCREFNDRVGKYAYHDNPPGWEPPPNHKGIFGTILNTGETFFKRMDDLLGGDDEEIRENSRDCGTYSHEHGYYDRYDPDVIRNDSDRDYDPAGGGQQYR